MRIKSLHLTRGLHSALLLKRVMVLLLCLSSTLLLAQETHWTPVTVGSTTYMAVTAIVQIDGVDQTDPQLELAAFCAGECRGAVLPTHIVIPGYVDYYKYGLNVHGDSGDVFTFKLYDHSIEQELVLYSPPAIPFNADGYGNLINPYILNFKTGPIFIIAIEANPTSGGTVSGGGFYDLGTSCTLTATPNTGYHFVNWTKDGTQVSTDASYTFIVTENATYVANFMLNCYTIGVSASPSDGGTATGSGAYDYGSSCTVTATANPGYTFMYWKENDEVVSTNANYNFTVTGERNLVAHFALPFTISATASPAEGGTVSGGGAFDYGTTCNMTATANPGYTFMYWKEGDEIVSNEANYSFTVTGERNLVAHFALPFTITVTANPTEGGTVSGGGTFNYGANCTLIATANPGYTFTNWTKNGVVVSTQSHYSFAASESANYVANFALNNYTIAIKASPSETGSVSIEMNMSAPIFSLASGTYYEVQSVSLFCATEGATIYYSTTSENGPWTVYSNALTVNESTTIWAYTAKEGYSNSPIVSTSYIIQLGLVYILNQDWEGDMNGWTFVDVSGSASWSIFSYQSNHYAYVNGYNHGINEDWLISPPLNLDTCNNPTLRFRTARNYTGNAIEVFFSNDYNGSDPTLATWTALPCALSTGSWTWVESGDIDLSNFSGTNCYIGFKYTNTETQAAGWQVDDIQLISYGLPINNNLDKNDNFNIGKSLNADYERISDLNSLYPGCRIVLAARYDDTENSYYAMSNTITSGKSVGVLFTSTTNEGDEILPASIVDEEESYYWIVGITDNGYTFTNAAGEMIGYGNGTNFATNGEKTLWNIEVRTAGESAMVPNYTGFYITNATTTGRGFALNNNHNYGAYVVSNNNSSGYNFYLDIFLEGGNSPWQYANYDYGSTVTLNATPNEGYVFTNWTESGEVVSTDPEYSFVVTQNRYLIANFAEGCTVSVSVNPETGGTVTGVGTYPAGSSCTLTATPNPGYTFANWSIGATAITTSPTYSFTVNGNRTMVANFNYQGYHFVTEGAWNNPDNWMPVGVPTNTDDVYIETSVTIPNECVALANEITVINPAANITIAEGGQLITSNAVDGTIQKSITGYGEGEDGYYFIASPVDNFNPNDGGLLTANYDLYYFDLTQEGEEWRNYEAASFNLNTGEGYLYASQTDVTLNITGELTATKAPIALANETGAAFEGWNLIGNPYPCNVTINVPFYRMDSDGSGLAAQTTSLETTAIKPMEGVFVQYTTEAPSVTFTKAPNVSATGSRGALNLSLNQGRGLKDNAIIRFDGGKTLEKFTLRKSGSNIFIPHEGKDYAVVNAGKHGDIPFSFKAGENGSYTLSFSNEDVTFDYLHLIDNMTGNDVDLLANPSYSFEAKTTDYASRFRLVFSTGSNANDETFAFNNGSEWVVANEGEATLQVIDVTGRVLSSEKSHSAFRIPNSAFSTPGVYVMQLINGDSVRTQKVLVK